MSLRHVFLPFNQIVGLIELIFVLFINAFIIILIKLDAM